MQMLRSFTMMNAALMQVLTAGQELVFDYQGDMFILRPLSMMIAASQDKSAPQGLLTDTTAMTFEAAPGNYGEAAYPALMTEGLKEQRILMCCAAPSLTPEECGRTGDRSLLLHDMRQGAARHATALIGLLHLALWATQCNTWH